MTSNDSRDLEAVCPNLGPSLADGDRNTEVFVADVPHARLYRIAKMAVYSCEEKRFVLKLVKVHACHIKTSLLTYTFPQDFLRIWTAYSDADQ